MKVQKTNARVQGIADEIRCVYPHITKGFSKLERGTILRAYYRPLLEVSADYWDAIMEEFHRLSRYVRPANMYEAIETIVGAEYPEPRPSLQRTQHTAFEELQIHEGQDRRWEQRRRQWVRDKISRDKNQKLGTGKTAVPSVQPGDVSNGHATAQILEMRPVS